MSEFITSTLIIAAEFGAVIIFLFLVVMAILFIRRKKEVGMANEFTQRFRETSKDRRENLGKEISEIFSLDGDEGDNFAARILNNERKLCSNALRIFRGKDKSLILTFQDELANLSGAYHELATVGNKQVIINEQNELSSNKDNLDSMTAEVKVLREENSRLKEDLKKALENVDYLQIQYTELFDKTKSKQG
jgi:hypothetical protein